MGALLNAHCSEEVAFTLLCVILEDGLVPPDYFTCLTGAVIDQQVLEQLMKQFCPALYLRLVETASLEDFSVVAIPWFMCLFSATLSADLTARLWDFLFLLGPCVVFRCALGLIRRLAPGDSRAELAALLKALTERDIEQFALEGLITNELIGELRDQARRNHAASSPCHLTVAGVGGAEGARPVPVDDNYFPTSALPTGQAAHLTRARLRRQRVLKEIDAFLGK